jgi:hypothetical protein
MSPESSNARNKIYSTIDPRSAPKSTRTSVTQGWDLPRRKIPCSLDKFPARAEKFPAPLSREFAYKRLMLLAFWMRESPSEALFSKNSLLNSLPAGNLTWRLVRSGLHPPPRSPMRTDVSRSPTNLRAVPRVQTRDVRSLPPVEVAIASILPPGLWALQTRSWRRGQSCT